MENGQAASLHRLVRHSLAVGIALAAIVVGGLMVLPQRAAPDWLPHYPMDVDAIPDIGENQQIVVTHWSGRSPQDVEDQISYPLTTSLLGMGGVKSIRSRSMFGLSVLYVVFDDNVDFDRSRARISERILSLPQDLLPDGTEPALGPESTGLGQVYWYTLEAIDDDGEPTGGWELSELRTAQDYIVRYALGAVPGVSEVASIGGFVREYHVTVRPAKLAAFNLTAVDVLNAVRKSHAERSGRALEINRVEYVIRGRATVDNIDDISDSVVKMTPDGAITVKDVADVSVGPGPRRGILDREGVEAVGGVVAIRHGANPVTVLQALKSRIAELQPSLPRKKLADGRTSRLTIKPFYDRSRLIGESLDTLATTISNELIITMIVAVVLAFSARTGAMIAGLLPVAVLGTFVTMKLLGIQANILALSGIAIAIGTMVDMGVIVGENILRHLHARPETEVHQVVMEATREVAGVITTAVCTTVISFLPIFALQASEGKLFHPLALTKTIAILCALLVALGALPALAAVLYRRRRGLMTEIHSANRTWLAKLLLTAFLLIMLTDTWSPLGVDAGLSANILFVAPLILGILGAFRLFRAVYVTCLAWCLDHGTVMLLGAGALITAGAAIWSGTKSEFMPTLDEGAFLLMPSTAPHAGLTETHEVMALQDRILSRIPEISSAVGKAGRAETALDPAPVSMIETLINYHPEYLRDDNGSVRTFAFDATRNDLFRNVDGDPVRAPDGQPYTTRGRFIRNDGGQLVPDRTGQPFRLWRPALDPALNPGRNAWPGINTESDIWQMIDQSTRITGLTVAPRLQPIETRLIMLQTGLRAPFGIRMQAGSLEKIEQSALSIENNLRKHPMIRSETVVAERANSRPYLEFNINRQELIRYGLTAADVLDNMSVAVAGEPTMMIDAGRQRTRIRVRYPRELRDHADAVRDILVDTRDGKQVRLGQVGDVTFVAGPQMIKSENGFLTGYVMFDRRAAFSNSEVAAAVQDWLRTARATGKLDLPVEVQVSLTGTFINEVRANQRLRIIIPLSLLVIFLLLYGLFKSSLTSLIVFSGVLIAWSGGFIMIWLYNQPWFLDMQIAGIDLRQLFQVSPVRLSVAMWVGFLALFGTATDDGVVLASYLRQVLKGNSKNDQVNVNDAVMEACQRRIRPCLMTTATTIIALLPILTSDSRGAEVLRPMAIPVFGGMIAALLSTLVVPVLLSYAARSERARSG